MLSRFFIDRPVFATVISIVIVILGAVSMGSLPIAQYPEIVPPTIQVTAAYPGANAKIVSETVASPIEQEVNGVENMLYMNSKCTNDGRMTLDITFKLGTNLDMAQVLVQNRVAIAEPKLPEEVRRQGINTKKRSPNILLVVNLVSPNESRDQLYLSNYATLNVKDALARIEGVGDIFLFGGRDYSMRVWLDPEQLASRDMNPGDVLKALSEQNVQVAAGTIGQSPLDTPGEIQLAISTQGRLLDPTEFARVIVKTGADGQVVRLSEVGRVELGARTYDSVNMLDGKPSVGVVIFQLPGSNALSTAERIRAEMETLKKSFPDDMSYEIVYDTTVFVEESIAAVYHTLIEAFLLVFIVILLFLQDWKATILPMIDVPVSLIGTFAVMSALGFSLNNLTLFGLVLAIGIVVDDAIVVLENIERWLAQGMDVRSATIKAMDEVTGPIIAITLVLSSVFIPTAFIAGISGQFYRQFALTIAASTIISAINAMTMTPSRAVQILGGSHGGGKDGDKDGAHGHKKEALPWWGVGGLAGLVASLFFYDGLASWLGLPAGEHGAGHSGAEHHAGWLETWLTGLGVPGNWMGFAGGVALFTVVAIPGLIVQKPVRWALDRFLVAFNKSFDRVAAWYGVGVKAAVRMSLVMLLLYGGMMWLTAKGFQTVPAGFIPEQDKGYLIVFGQLPDGATLDRTEKVMRRAAEIALETPGVIHTINVPGFSLFTGGNLTNHGTMFLTLAPFEDRVKAGNQSAFDIARTLRQKLWELDEGMLLVLNAPPVDGLGNAGGFKMQVQDRRGSGLPALQEAVDNLAQTASAPGTGLVGVFSTFRSNEPQLYLEIDRTKAKAAGVELADVFQTLTGYLGTAYVNDFTFQNRNWQVNMQADARFRTQPDDVRQLKVRNGKGLMVPLGSLLEVREVSGPSVVSRYNMYPSADLMGSLLPNISSGQALTTMEQLAGKELPSTMGFEWTDLSLQQQLAGNTAVFVFLLGTLFVYLVLASQYESWTLPLAVILIVPMCLFAAIAGLWLNGRDNNIFTQIGLLVLIGLASKNAILIVEFARQLKSEGKSTFDAVVEACQLRLRPIVMTSLAFILGVVPLVRAVGAGAEMRQALGLAVFSGMLGVTFFGLFFTPVFYYLIERFLGKSPATANAPSSAPASPAPKVDITGANSAVPS